jgi:hypothetical protein
LFTVLGIPPGGGANYQALSPESSTVVEAR